VSLSPFLSTRVFRNFFFLLFLSLSLFLPPQITTLRETRDQKAFFQSLEDSKVSLEANLEIVLPVVEMVAPVGSQDSLALSGSPPPPPPPFDGPPPPPPPPGMGGPPPPPPPPGMGGPPPPPPPPGMGGPPPPPPPGGFPGAPPPPGIPSGRMLLFFFLFSRCNLAYHPVPSPAPVSRFIAQSKMKQFHWDKIPPTSVSRALLYDCLVKVDFNLLLRRCFLAPQHHLGEDQN